MKKLVTGIIFLCFTAWLWAGNVQPDNDPPIRQFETESTISPCVKALLDGQEISDEDGLRKSSEGELKVEKEEDHVYFNLVLKSYIGKNEPPLYLRFIKVDRLDIQKVLKYANIGDEIFIEPFSTDGFKCLPSHFVIT